MKARIKWRENKRSGERFAGRGTPGTVDRRVGSGGKILIF